jgi:hypothetical protein
VLEAYQEQVVRTLCSPSGPAAKQGLGRHTVKAEPYHACPYRCFRRAGFWTEDRQLCTASGTLRFRPALVECRRCGKRLTPLLGALGLAAHQRSTAQQRRTVIEAALETSYRRAVVLCGLSVSKSTAHRWASGVDLPVRPSGGWPFLGADGMKFQRAGGTRGEVRVVAEMGRKGRIRPLGVWAGVPWKQIAGQVKRRQSRRASQFLSDGELAIERWLSPLGRRGGRCLWHLQRDSRYALWSDRVSKEERRQIRARLQQIVTLQPPVPQESRFARDQQRLRQQLRRRGRTFKPGTRNWREGCGKTAGYLAHAQDKLFSHLELWLATGRLGLKTTSTMESMIRELARRLKKVGWNWSDAGALRMGRMVLWRRYVPAEWQQYWQKRIPLQGRCRMQLITCERRAA